MDNYRVVKIGEFLFERITKHTARLFIAIYAKSEVLLSQSFNGQTQWQN